MTTHRYPALINAPVVTDQQSMDAWMQQVTEILRLSTGQQSPQLSVDNFTAGVAASQAQSGSTPAGSTGTSETTSDLTPLPNPGKVEASGGFANVYLRFEPPETNAPWYAEIWRGSATAAITDAVLQGTTQGRLYVDNLGTDETEYRYWVRFVKVSGDVRVNGSFSPSINAKVKNEGALPSSVIGELYVDKVVGEVAGFLKTHITDGFITNAMIGNEIKSDNYEPGKTGWRINKNGDIELSNGLVRGLIEGSQIKGSVIESSVMILDPDRPITMPTEADQGISTVRHLTYLEPYVGRASVSASVVAQPPGAMLYPVHDLTVASPIVSANYTGAGQADGAWKNHKRYRYFHISPSVTFSAQGMSHQSHGNWITGVRHLWFQVWITGEPTPVAFEIGRVFNSSSTYPINVEHPTGKFRCEGSYRMLYDDTNPCIGAISFTVKVARHYFAGNDPFNVRVRATYQQTSFSNDGAWAPAFSAHLTYNDSSHG